jgi:lipoprotein signal peptidase
MQNVWKYSLLLAFSIIIDQLFKGSAQSLVEIPSASEVLFEPLYLIRSRNYLFFLHFDFGLSPNWSNRISLIFNVAALLGCFWWTIKWRNVRPDAGWSLSLIACGLFSSTMDRYSHGFTLDYLGLKLSDSSWVNFSLGDLEFLLGLVMGIFLLYRRRVKT